MSKLTELEFQCMEMERFKKRRYELRDFLRKPYQYTSAECKCDQQEKIHEFDWLK